MEPYTITARWIFPVDRPPLAGGTITIHGERIHAVETAGMRTAEMDLGNVAILPGFVNAHTHLDLSDAVGLCRPSPDFVGWLRAVIAHRRRQSPEDVAKAIDMGLAQCMKYGTTLVGDIAAGGISWERLANAPLRAVVFYELLGLTLERAQKAFAAAEAWLRHHPATPTCQPGLSPHAPYSVHQRLLEWAAHLAHVNDLPLSIHLAETEAEVELLATHTGPFVRFLEDLGVWREDGLLSSFNKVMEIAKEVRTLSFVHGNYLEILNPSSPNVCNIFCPRTHAAFGHSAHPFQLFQNQGMDVALGTDSLASNPDLDILAEARFLHARYPQVSGETILKMATLGGARALGRAHETGSLSAGKSADVVVLPLPNEEPVDPHLLVLESTLPVRSVIFRGVDLSFCARRAEASAKR